MALSRKIVKLVEYNPEWPGFFKTEARKLGKILKLDRSRIEHVGSTAIPGMSAKSVIDIAVGVSSVGEFGKYQEMLKKAGYVLRPNAGSTGRQFYAKGAENSRTHYVHLVEYKNGEWENLIKFRDYLIKNPDKAQEYATLKQELADKYPNDRDSYKRGKEEFIAKILVMSK